MYLIIHVLPFFLLFHGVSTFSSSTSFVGKSRPATGGFVDVILPNEGDAILDSLFGSAQTTKIFFQRFLGKKSLYVPRLNAELPAPIRGLDMEDLYV